MKINMDKDKNRLLLNWVMITKDAGGVERTHTIPTIQNHYSVGEHSYGVAMLAMTILMEGANVQGNKEYTGTVLPRDIMWYALIHDMPEIEVGDIPAPIKKRTSMKSSLDRIEDEWYEEVFPDWIPCPNDIDSRAKGIVSLADSLDFLVFCIREVELGNTGKRFLAAFGRGVNYAIQKYNSMDLESDTAIEILNYASAAHEISRANNFSEVARMKEAMMSGVDVDKMLKGLVNNMKENKDVK